MSQFVVVFLLVFGALLAIAGAAIFVVFNWFGKGGTGENSIGWGPVKVKLSRAELVIFVGGVMVMLVAVFLLPEEGPQPVAYTLGTPAEPSEGGEVSGAGTGIHAPGSQVTLEAKPKPEYRFDRWAGDCSGIEPECSLTMNSNKTVLALFQSTVALSPAASAAPAASAPPAPREITLPSSINIPIASFALPSGQFLLTSVVDPAGGGTVRGGGVYKAGARVKVEAVAASGYLFRRWSDDCARFSNSSACTVTMDSNKNAHATFVKIVVPLTVPSTSPIRP